MDFWPTLLLGAIAGSTIFLGLPLARMQSPAPRTKAFLNALSAGILLFLLVDILASAAEPIERLAESAHEGAASWSQLAGLVAMYALGLAVGLLSLLYVDRRLRSRPVGQSVGPGAMAVAEASSAARALQLGMSVAVGIGLHNLSEGLAIGQSARGGEIQLALLLVVGFALHNATEGFGIAGPLASGGVRPSRGYLVAAGLVAGGPTVLGTAVGYWFTSEYLFVAFLTMAAGAIIYVLGELLATGRKLGPWDITVWGILTGFLLGLATELLLLIAGG